MNRSEIRTLIIATTGRSDKETLINSAINIALRKVSAEALWNDLLTEADVTTGADDTYVTLADNVRRLTEVRWIDGLNSSRIVIQPKTWIIRLYPAPDELPSGVPLFGYLQGLRLYLVPPVAEADYTIRYSYYPLHADLSDDTTETTIPQADEAVIAYATYWVFKSLEQHDDAERWLIDYRLRLVDAKRMDLSSAVDYAGRPRGLGDPVSANYYLDPFVRSMP